MFYVAKETLNVVHFYEKLNSMYLLFIKKKKYNIPKTGVASKRRISKAITNEDVSQKKNLAKET